MADWPGTEELKRVLNVDIETDNWTDTLDRVLASAIAWVKQKVGAWDDSIDEPDESLAQAALRMAELIALRPETAAAIGENDPTLKRLLFGHRRRFGIS
jgi:hypothetical protein